MDWAYHEALAYTVFTFYIVSLMTFALLNYRDAKKTRELYDGELKRNQHLIHLLDANAGRYCQNCGHSKTEDSEASAVATPRDNTSQQA